MEQKCFLHDRRKTSRKQMQFTAWIETAHKEPLACAVLDMTLKGARLRTPDVAVPNDFTLMLKLGSSLRRRCKVAWRKGFVIGVEFLEACPDETHRHSDATAKTAQRQKGPADNQEQQEQHICTSRAAAPNVTDASP